jgi:hypothetical protein
MFADLEKLSAGNDIKRAWEKLKRIKKLIYR